MPDEIVLTQKVTPHPVGTAAQMGEALEWGLSIGYRGHVQAATNPNTGLVIWVVEFHSDAGNDMCRATMGDVLLWDGKTLSALSGEEFAARAAR